MLYHSQYGMKVAGQGPGNKAMEGARVPWRGRRGVQLEKEEVLV